MIRVGECVIWLPWGWLQLRRGDLHYTIKSAKARTPQELRERPRQRTDPPVVPVVGVGGPQEGEAWVGPLPLPHHSLKPGTVFLRRPMKSTHQLLIWGCMLQPPQANPQPATCRFPACPRVHAPAGVGCCQHRPQRRRWRIHGAPPPTPHAASVRQCLPNKLHPRRALAPLQGGKVSVWRRCA